MNLRNKVLILMVGLIALSGAFLNFEKVGAQRQTEPQPTVTPTPEVEAEDEPIRIDTEVVTLLFTAQDKNRRLLTDLRMADVKLLEDGVPQDITAFTRQVDLPLSIAILIDTSQSQERTLPEEKSAAKSFIESVVRASKDEVAIVSFTGEATLEQGMTNNVARLQRAVDRVQFVPASGSIGGGVYTGGQVPGTPPISGTNQQSAAATALWDAIWITADEVLGPAPEKTRRAIILLTDGYNTYGKKKLDEAVQAALKSEAVIYTIGIGDNFYGGVDQPALRKISERTGGRAFFPEDEADLRKAFAQIQIEMRSQFQIAYEPTNQKRDGSFRRIEIQIVNPELSKQKVTLTHRQGYFAKSDGKK